MATLPRPGVQPPDPQDAIDALMQHLGLSGDQPIVSGNAADAGRAPGTDSMGNDSAAILRGEQSPSSVLTRQNKIGPDGGVSADFTPSPYNMALDKQNADESARQDKMQALEEMFNAPGGEKDKSGLKQQELAVAPNIQAKSATDVEKMREEADKYKADQLLEAAKLKGHGGIALTSTEQGVVDAGIAGQNEGKRLQQMLETAHPDIAEGPDKYSSITDRLPSAIGNLLISHGIAAGTHSNATELNTSISQLQANIAKMKSSGRLSGAIYDKLIQGMPQVGFSDGENYKRLSSTMQDLDNVLGGIAQAHGAQVADLTHSGAQAQADTSASDYNDPAGLR